MSLVDKVFNRKEFSTSNWKIRRRIVIITLVYCSVVFLLVTGFISSVIWFKGDRSFDQNIINILNGIQSTLGLVATSVIGAYVFGATWDTASYRKNISSLTYQGKDKRPQVSPDTAAEDSAEEDRQAKG